MWLCVQAAAAGWRDAREAGVDPDLILYSAMIDACAKVLGKPWGAAGRHLKEHQRCALPAGQPACSLPAPPQQSTNPPL